MSEEEIKTMALKMQSALLESSYQMYRKLEQENTQLKSVLKEIREYIKEQTKELENTNDKITHCLSYQDLIDEYKELLEIIDKGIKENE